MHLKKTGTKVLSLHFTEQLVLPPLFIRPGSCRFQYLPSSYTLSISYHLPILLFMSSVPRLTIFFWVVPHSCYIYILITLPPSVYVIHPSFVNGLYLHLFSIFSPMHDLRLPLPYFSWCLCSSGMLCGICWLVRQYSALSQSNSDMIRTQGTDCSMLWIRYAWYRLQYAVDTLQSAAFVLQIKADGKYTSLTWKWKQQMAMKQSQYLHKQH